MNDTGQTPTSKSYHGIRTYYGSDDESIKHDADISRKSLP